MKYKKILIFLIICIITISVALITFAFLSKDTKNEYANVALEENTSDNNIIQKNETDLNISDLNNTSQDNVTVGTNVIQDKSNKEETKKVITEEKNEEDNNVTKKSQKEKQDEAINLVRNNWGEDDTVYYTIDNNSGDTYDISVRSKSTTETLAEYEVDIINKTVQIK